MSTKISELPSATTPVGAQFCIIQGGTTKRLPTSALGGVVSATEGTIPLYDASGRLVANGIVCNSGEGNIAVDVVARGLHARDERVGYPQTRLLFEASGVPDDTTYDVTLPTSKSGMVALISDIPTWASQAEAEAGTATNKAMSPLRVAQAIAELATGGEAAAVATSAEAKAATGDTQMMTPLKVKQARRVVERLDIPTSLGPAEEFALGVNMSTSDRVVIRFGWAVTSASPAGDAPAHRWTLESRGWSGASFDGAPVLSYHLATATTLPADWEGINIPWYAGQRLVVTYQDLSGSGSFMGIGAAELEFEWRDA